MPSHRLTDILHSRIARRVALIFLVLLIFACGKKAPPTLKSYEKPPAPSGLAILQKDRALIISWSFPEDKEQSIAGFVLLKSIGSQVEKISLAPNVRTFSDTEYRTGDQYIYKIIAVSPRRVFSNESNAVAITPVQPPVPPSEVSFTINADSVTLKWKKPGPDVFFNVYRTFKKGEYGPTPANASPMKENFFSDQPVLDKTVFYTIRSVIITDSIIHEGLPSKELHVSPADFVPSAPKDLSFYAAPDKVFLYWTALPEAWVTGYRIYRKTANEDYKLIGDTQIPTFIDAEPPLTRRDYKVSGVGPVKEGPASELTGVVFVPER